MSGIHIEVVFALPERQWLRALTIATGTTVESAILQSGLLEDFPETDIESAAVGIWGNEVERDRVLRDGDRVEVYRALELDPREARRRFALDGRTMNVGESSEDD